MVKKISLVTAILMIINIMVGSGILIGPGLMAAISGNASFLAWALAALIFLPIVLGIAQLNRMFPYCGGFYTYAKEGLGNKAGLVSGFVYVLGYTLAASVEILALRQVMLAAGLNYWFITSPMAFNIITVALCVGLNLLAITVFGRIINSMTISKLLPLIILIVLIPFVIKLPFAITAQEISLVPLSMFPMAIFGYFGFEYCCGLSHLIENSEKNAPRALMIGFLGTGVLYSLFHFGLLQVMGAHNLGQLGAAGASSFGSYLPMPYIGQVLAFLIPVASMITLFAAANGMINGNAVVLQSIAQESKSSTMSWLTKTTSWGRPWAAIFFLAAIIFILITWIPYINSMGGLSNVAILASFLLPLISLLVLQKKAGLPAKSLLLTSLGIITASALALYSVYTML